MPIYEYRCDACKRRFTALVGVVAGDAPLACPRCGGEKLTKLVSRFASFRSDSDVDDIGDLDEIGDDPSAARRLARKMGSEFGEDLGEDFEDDVESALDDDRAADEMGEDEN
jgi:putative FmdB family regulatory protein